MNIGNWQSIGLWAAVVASGLYHGFNPAMGWPLAVSNGMLARSPRALFGALGFLVLGHAAAMLAVLLPFGMLASLAQWQAGIRLAAGLLVTGYGVAMLARRRHPRAIARIPPSRLALWSFAIALAHGAALMLVPLYLGLCRADVDAGHRAMGALAYGNVAVGLWVALVHAAAMMLMAGVMAWLTYRYVGLTLVARSWFNAETLWAASLIMVGGASLLLLMAG